MESRHHEDVLKRIWWVKGINIQCLAQGYSSRSWGANDCTGVVQSINDPSTFSTPYLVPGSRSLSGCCNAGPD